MDIMDRLELGSRPDTMSFATTILNWYDRNGRELPWRATNDAYLVWLSEIILQQTRVDQGMAYYFRFAERFPNVHALAQAQESEVLRLWQGLGYYSRARNLHATARVISSELKGVFPDAYTDLLKLKGIGPYTAAAIASFSFGECKAVVDGNVMRVLARVYGVEDAIDTTAGKNRFQDLADSLISTHRPGDFNQAIMDFGALCCTPRNPGCATCPFEQDCIARREGRIGMLPVKSRKTAVQDVWYYYAIPVNAGHTWVRERRHSGIWKGLHDFPCVESDGPLRPVEVRHRFLKELGLVLPGAAFRGAGKVVHQLSHRRIHAAFFRWEGKNMWNHAPESYRQIPWESLSEIGLPRLLDRYLNAH